MQIQKRYVDELSALDLPAGRREVADLLVEVLCEHFDGPELSKTEIEQGLLNAIAPRLTDAEEIVKRAEELAS